eukprot:gene1789-1993_t
MASTIPKYDVKYFKESPLRDSFSFLNRLEKFSNPHIRPLWRQARTAKADALRTRISRTAEILRTHSRSLCPLTAGDPVFLQNQQGHNANKWDRSGLVVDSLGHDQYRVKVDGSGRLTLRNCRFLRSYTPVSPATQPQFTAPLPPGCHPDQAPMSVHAYTVLPQEVTQSPPTAPLSPIHSRAPRPSTDCPSPEHGSLDDPSPATVITPAPRSAPELPSSAPEHGRPHLIRRPPKHFEPETGMWTER